MARRCSCLAGLAGHCCCAGAVRSRTTAICRGPGLFLASCARASEDPVTIAGAASLAGHAMQCAGVPGGSKRFLLGGTDGRSRTHPFAFARDRVTNGPCLQNDFRCTAAAAARAAAVATTTEFAAAAAAATAGTAIRRSGAGIIGGIQRRAGPGGSAYGCCPAAWRCVPQHTGCRRRGHGVHDADTDHGAGSPPWPAAHTVFLTSAAASAAVSGSSRAPRSGGGSAQNTPGQEVSSG